MWRDCVYANPLLAIYKNHLMLRIHFIILLALTLTTNFIYGQFHDTTKLKIIIASLSTPVQHKNLWDKLHQLDQNLAQKAGNHDSLFERNLILTCMYINKFGFPNPKICGDKGYIASYIWVHTKYLDIEKFTFPIILQGYKSGIIEHNDMMNYYISGIYSQEFDIKEDYQNTNLDFLYTKLQVNLSDTININELITRLSAFHAFEKGRRNNLGIWQIYTPRDTLRYNGLVIPRGGDGEKCQMFQHENKKHYFGFLDSTQEYKEIEFINSKRTKFKVKNYHGVEYYEILQNGDITWFRKHNMIIIMKKLK